MEYCPRNEKTTPNDEAKPQQITLKECLPFYLKRQKMKIYLEFESTPYYSPRINKTRQVHINL